MLGSKLGPYELIEEVGRGGMASVYRAYQPNMDRFVAVKVIFRAIASDNKALDRFQREARLVARLEHPHILPVYDYDGSSDPPYIVMRYLSTGTLKDILEREQLPVQEVAYLFSQIASALDYAHRQGVIHRDIKPSNIMVDGEGNAFLTDFGIARATEMTQTQGLTGTGIAIGTPGYMSPEQSMGTPIDGRADIYAMGVMLFEMLSGKLPFRAETPMAVIMKHLHDPVPELSTLNTSLPPAVDMVIQRAMAKNADDRFNTAGEMSRALNIALGPAVDVGATPLRLQAVAARTILDLAAGRAEKAQLEANKLSSGPTVREAATPPPVRPPPRPPTAPRAIPNPDPNANPAGRPPTGTQTVAVSTARGAVLGAGVVVALLALFGIGALIASTVINNTNASNTQSTSTAAAVALASTQNSIDTAARNSTAIAQALTSTAISLPSATTAPTLAPSATTVPPTSSPTNAPIVIAANPTLNNADGTATSVALSLAQQTLDARETYTVLGANIAASGTAFARITPSATPSPLPTFTLTHTPSATVTTVPPTASHTPNPPTLTVTSSVTSTATSTATVTASSTASSSPSPLPTQTATALSTTAITLSPIAVSPTLTEIVAATLPPVILPTAAVVGTLPYVNDMEATDSLKYWDYDPTAWQLLPDSGNTSLVGSGGQAKLALVLSKASPAPQWDDPAIKSLVISTSINLDSQGSFGRIIFRQSDSGYYALNFAPGLMLLSRGTSGTINRGSELQLQTYSAPIHNAAFFQLLIWCDETRVFVYLEHRLVIQVRDQQGPVLPGGQIILQTVNGGAQNAVRYDNLKIQLPNAASQHFDISAWPTTWTRSNVTDATLGTDSGSNIHYINQVAGTVSPNSGTLTDFLLTARINSVQGGFDMHLRESATGYFLMHFEGGNMTLSIVDNSGKATPVTAPFQNFYGPRGTFQDFTFELVGTRLTIYSKDIWSQDIKTAPLSGGISFVITKPNDQVRIGDIMIAETAKSATEVAQWAFDKISTIEARPNHQLLTEFYDYFIDKFATQQWWEGGVSAPGDFKFDKTSRDYSTYVELTYKAGADYRQFRNDLTLVHFFGQGTDKVTFRDSSDIYLRVNVRLAQAGTVWIAVRTSVTTGGSALSGYRVKLTRNPDNSYSVSDSVINSKGQETVFYTGSLPVDPNTSIDPTKPAQNWIPLLVIAYHDKAAFFANNRFLNSIENTTILNGTTALGVDPGTVADFDHFQMRSAGD